MKKEVSRRQFLLWTALAGAVGSRAEGQIPSVDREPLGISLIGTGDWGRTLLGYLIKVPGFRLISLCDLYEPHLKRALQIAGGPTSPETDYRRVLDDKQVSAVIVATPPHTHRPIVSDALQAGKHVWCEVPLAHTVEECGALAQTGSQASVTVQVGLQKRYNPTVVQALKFHRAGAIGRAISWSGRWNRKESWRRVARDRAMEDQINWRLNPDLSGGLVTEVLLHHFDLASTFLGGPPVRVQAWGSLLLWQDGRQMPDTVTALLTFSDQVRADFHATLANSFQEVWDIFTGEYGTMFFQGLRGLLFREADARPLGWEVYAKREKLGRSEGYIIVANATKLLEQGKLPGEIGVSETLEDNEIYQALASFLQCCRTGTRPVANLQRGLEASVVALKAFQSLRSEQPVAIRAGDLQIQ